MEIVETEVGRHAWGDLRCGCGRSAAHLEADLLRLATAEDKASSDIDSLQGHVFMPSVIFEPAVPVVSVALAALADDVSDDARVAFLYLLLILVGDEGQAVEAWAEGRNLPSECVAAAKGGIWTLYSEVFSGRSVDAASYAYEVLDIIEDDRERLDSVRVAAAASLRWDLR